MKGELKGRVALVTGSSRGIGKAIATAFAREGADVILCASGSAGLKAAKAELEKFGGKVYVHTLDATNPAQVKAMVAKVAAEAGGLDILVNNLGGVLEHAKFEEITDEQWLHAWKFNFMTAVSFTREALPWLKRSKAARIINISSTAGKQPGGFNVHYGSAKTALNSLNKYLANEFAAQKILVNSIVPSTVNGGIWSSHIADKAKRQGVSIAEATKLMEAEVKSKTPVGEIGTPEDIGELALFLASDRAKFITGTCIAVDGGLIKSIF